VSQQVKVKPSLGHHIKNVLRHIMPLEAFDVILERPGQINRTPVYQGCFNKITFTHIGNKFLVSFSSFSRLMENQLQTHLKELLFGDELDNNIKSSGKPCERWLEIKQLEQKIKQFYEVNIVHLTRNGCKDLGSKVLSFTFVIVHFEQIPFVLLFSYFYRMVFDPKEQCREYKIKVETLERKANI